MTENKKLYTTQFLLLCISNFLFSASFNMIIPELPEYLSNLGGEHYKGLIIALFTLTAGISRPFSGKLTDTIGRIPILVIGTLVCVVCSLCYPLLTSVAGFLMLRFFHGFSTGFKPTASAAYIADIVPAHRRGEAMGIAGVFMNAGASISPPIGSYFANLYSIDILFYISSGFAFLSILILFNLKETLAKRVKFHPRLLIIKKDEIFDKTAIPPAILTALLYFGLGVILTISPDQSVLLGMSNKGMFFTSFTACSVLSRLVAGRVSDKYGRVPVMKFASIGVAISLGLIGFAKTEFQFLLYGGFFGFTIGTAAPAVMAWVIDRCADENRGRAMATLYIALEFGIGMGALISAWMFANNAENLPMTYIFSSTIALGAAIYLQFFFKESQVLNEKN